MSIADVASEVKPPVELPHVLERLRQQSLTPGLELDGPPRPLSGGFWAEMWTLPLSQPAGPLPAQVVLRLAPDAQAATRETAVQAAVAAQGYPTPRIHVSDTGRGALRAWSVMDFATGQPLLAGLNGLRALTSLPRLATGLPDTLARAAVALHQLDPEPLEAELNTLVAGSAGIEGLLEHYVGHVHALDDPPLSRLVERVATTRPDSKLRVICHGDLHPFNVLANGDQHVVLDWTAARIAHPAYDLAFTRLLLANPPLHAPRPLRPVINAAARRVAKRFLTTYTKVSPHPIDADTLAWYHSLQACRILLDIAGWRAAGTADLHASHPWFAIEPTLRPLLDA